MQYEPFILEKSGIKTNQSIGFKNTYIVPSNNPSSKYVNILSIFEYNITHMVLDILTGQIIERTQITLDYKSNISKYTLYQLIISPDGNYFVIKPDTMALSVFQLDDTNIHKIYQHEFQEQYDLSVANVMFSQDSTHFSMVSDKTIYIFYFLKQELDSYMYNLIDIEDIPPRSYICPYYLTYVGNDLFIFTKREFSCDLIPHTSSCQIQYINTRSHTILSHLDSVHDDEKQKNKYLLDGSYIYYRRDYDKFTYGFYRVEITPTGFGTPVPITRNLHIYRDGMDLEIRKAGTGVLYLVDREESDNFAIYRIQKNSISEPEIVLSAYQFQLSPQYNLFDSWECKFLIENYSMSHPFLDSIPSDTRLLEFTPNMDYIWLMDKGKLKIYRPVLNLKHANNTKLREYYLGHGIEIPDEILDRITGIAVRPDKCPIFRETPVRPDKCPIFRETAADVVSPPVGVTNEYHIPGTCMPIKYLHPADLTPIKIIKPDATSLNTAYTNLLQQRLK